MPAKGDTEHQPADREEDLNGVVAGVDVLYVVEVNPSNLENSSLQGFCTLGGRQQQGFPCSRALNQQARDSGWMNRLPI